MTSNGLWQSVLSRDRRADELFVYAVASTGIYCRPSCPSRRPRRDRVTFFPDATMAEAGGYRPCRRCHPERPAESPVTDRLKRACAAVQRAPSGRWSVARLAATAGASVPQIRRAFRSTLGMAPRDYVLACRHRRFLDALRDGLDVTDAIYASGFGSPSRVYSDHGIRGMTPATYGKGGEGARIGWSTIATRIGTVLVAFTDRGLCFVAVGDRRADLVETLHAEFPRAETATTGTRPPKALASAVRAAVAGANVDPALPLDVRGTAFQWRVWRALGKIPRGATCTYKELAHAIRHPKAVRAVARACATNPVALVLPCHRVVGSSGELRGYRWGVRVKHALIAAERANNS
jgi:AraC family transcriptional regulator, regulatory protein of adaptative response / methylated-DNA-[protein]-cysteine methyltransferase